MAFHSGRFAFPKIMKIEIYLWKGSPNQFAATYNGRTMAGQYFTQNHEDEIIKSFLRYGWISEKDKPELLFIPKN